MGAGVDDLPGYVGRCVPRPLACKLHRELQHLHPREMIVIPQGEHLRAKIAQVLGHQRKPRQPFIEGVQHRVPRRLDPRALHRRGAGGWDLPEGVKGAEMVDPQNIKELLAVADAVNPELIAVFFELFPVVDGIAPPLAGLREVVRRHPRHEGRPAVLL